MTETCNPANKDAMAMTVHLKLLRKHLEAECVNAGVSVHPEVCSAAFAPTGEPFVVLHCFGGEGEAEETFRNYAAGREGTLYWRVPREANSGGVFYMRLLISDKPALCSPNELYNKRMEAAYAVYREHLRLNMERYLYETGSGTEDNLSKLFGDD